MRSALVREGCTVEKDGARGAHTVRPLAAKQPAAQCRCRAPKSVSYVTHKVCMVRSLLNSRAQRLQRYYQWRMPMVMCFQCVAHELVRLRRAIDKCAGRRIKRLVTRAIVHLGNQTHSFGSKALCSGKETVPSQFRCCDMLPIIVISLSFTLLLLRFGGCVPRFCCRLLI